MATKAVTVLNIAFSSERGASDEGTVRTLISELDHLRNDYEHPDETKTPATDSRISAITALLTSLSTK